MPIELSRFVGVRFRPDDYRRLEEKAQGLGTSVSALLRAAALAAVLEDPQEPRRRRLAAQDLVNQLSRLGNNLNQQTRLFHQLRYRGLVPETAAVLALLKELRDLLEELSVSVAEAAR